jgi:hypothetical protein
MQHPCQPGWCFELPVYRAKAAFQAGNALHHGAPPHPDLHSNDAALSAIATASVNT